MMYSEFVEGTGCKESEHNYNIFCKLEAMYMNSNVTKQEVYEFGKKLVDNSKSEEQIRYENELKEQIEAEKKDAEYYEEKSKFYAEVMEDKKMAKYLKDKAKECRQQIRKLKWCLQ